MVETPRTPCRITETEPVDAEKSRIDIKQGNWREIELHTMEEGDTDIMAFRTVVITFLVVFYRETTRTL